MPTLIEKPKQRIRVTKTKGPGVEIKLGVRFNPDELGEARSQKIWDGVAALIAALLPTEEDRDTFLRDLERERAKALGKGGAR